MSNSTLNKDSILISGNMNKTLQIVELNCEQQIFLKIQLHNRTSIDLDFDGLVELIISSFYQCRI